MMGRRRKRVLVACEFSGIVRDAFLSQGYDAVSCDLLPSERAGPHIEGDVSKYLKDAWDLIVAFPPCTRLCLSGVRWLHERDLWQEMRESVRFFKSFLDAPCSQVAVENPVMHGYAYALIGRKPDFYIQPWQFGHGEVKRTCFYLKGLPELMSTEIVLGRNERVHRMPPSSSRWKNRSRTYPGIADAMAVQWGSVL